MRISFIKCQFSTGLFLAFLVALFASTGNASPQRPSAEKTERCNSQGIDILLAIKGDAEISGYGATHFKVNDVPFLASEVNSNERLCQIETKGIKVVHLSAPGFNQKIPFINVDKMYFDDDAAFVEISFPPTGKNADVFLRKKAGVWKVTRKGMWES